MFITKIVYDFLYFYLRYKVFRYWNTLSIYTMSSIPVQWSSLFIPYLHPSYTLESLKEIFESKYNIGKIKRIDFVRSPNQISAFVHFDTWYLNEFTLFLREWLETKGKYNLEDYRTYIRKKHTEHASCIGCQGRYIDYEFVDDIPLLIQKTKSRPICVLQETTADPQDTEIQHIRNTLEKYERRIELLEDVVTSLSSSPR
jgi:hypothetical protein